MVKMANTKITLIMGSILGSFGLVYGTTLLFWGLFGGYMLEGGLGNLNYGVLALLCAVPFVAGLLLDRRSHSNYQDMILSFALFSILFGIVHLVVVSSSEAMQGDAVIRILTVFPISALLLVASLYFTATNKKFT